MLTGRTFSVVAVCSLFAVTTAVLIAGAQDAQPLSPEVQAVVTTFVLQEPNDINDPGNVYSRAWFDIVGFMGHPCYSITNEEEHLCADTYGIHAPLKDIVDNGSLVVYLSEHHLLAAGASAVVSSVFSSTSSSSVFSSTLSSSIAPMTETGAVQSVPTAAEDAQSSSSVDYVALHQQRSAQLWQACSEKYQDDAAARSCYQRNALLLQRLDKDITPDTVE